MIDTKHTFATLSSLGHLVAPDKSKTLLSLQDKIKRELLCGSHVVTVLIDGVGYDSVSAMAKKGAPIISWAQKNGSIKPNSAQWPSTTAVQITSLHTGVPVEEHGIVEWVVYEPKLGQLISPLPFSFAREDKWGSLETAGLKASDLFPTRSFYADINKFDVGRSRVALPSAFAKSHFNSLFEQDTTIVPYDNFTQGCTTVAQQIRQTIKPSYSLFYIDDMDKISHNHTKNSAEFTKRLEEILSTIRDSLVGNLKGLNRPCTVFITSDHGHMSVDPKTTLYVNHLIPEIDNYLQRNPQGEVIPCSGGYRSLFLHAKPECRMALIGALKRPLANKALVLPIEELFELGFFDRAECGENFWKRVGNIVVLPLPRQTVYYHIPGKFEMRKSSLHGGASKEEMTTPLITFKVSDFHKDGQ
jgi:predicted AlkP superfamily pyrophosphatase or phosphodiesterase